MGRKRIKSNFYLIDGYVFERTSEIDFEHHCWMLKKHPEGYLYSGWGFQHPTKIRPEDLPEDYLLLDNYKKHGYIKTSGIKSLVYKRSPCHNHTFKDDVIYISYTKDISGCTTNGFEEGSAYAECDEYIFGMDIVNFIAAVDKYSPNIDTTTIKAQMVEQYNAYCDEMNEWHFQSNLDKISNFDELFIKGSSYDQKV